MEQLRTPLKYGAKFQLFDIESQRFLVVEEVKADQDLKSNQYELRFSPISTRNTHFKLKETSQRYKNEKHEQALIEHSVFLESAIEDEDLSLTFIGNSILFTMGNASFL